MDFEDQEEHDEEMEMEPSYDSLVHNNNNNNNSNSGGGGGGGGRVKMASSGGGEGAVAVAAQQPTRKACRYRECLKNHAVGLGGHALDGCGEFLAAGADGTLDALKCAACSCHRNFHRKETDEPYGQLVPHQGHVSSHHHGFGHPQFSPTATGYYRTPGGYLHVTTQHRPLALPSTSGGGGTDQDDDMSNPSGGGGGGGFGMGMGMGTTSSKKRFRTKFSQEQKERMLELAERLSWRIQKQDEAAVQSFCDETGVKRHVLKVWMHNNKHTLGKKP